MYTIEIHEPSEAEVLLHVSQFLQNYHKVTIHASPEMVQIVGEDKFDNPIPTPPEYTEDIPF